jgi:hypothetical protein
MFYVGVVENRNDPLKIGRCKVRVVGLHTEDKSILPTDELPWAVPMGSIYSASISGIGRSPTGVVQGSTVLIIFLDGDPCQQPVMLGTLYGIPHTQSAGFVNDALNSVVTTDEGGQLVSSNGDSVTDIINDLVADIISETVQQSGEKYQMSTTQDSDGTVSYLIRSKTDSSVIASAVYNAETGVYESTLKNPENHTQKQYLPFTQSTPKTFTSQDEMLKYFESKF